jgi:dTDP-4-dehydrorhamnose reductase
VLITGAAGQLARALVAASPAAAKVRALTHAELDIADEAAVGCAMRELEPQLLINAAAFTRVDEAEAAPGTAARANSLGPAVLAAACRTAGVWLTHVSTDFVFGGHQGHPYEPGARPDPQNVYGRTKLDGETAVLAALPAGGTVVRASWLYSARGGFPARMLELMRNRPQLTVVSDQVGAPTSARGLAAVLWALSERRAAGVWHWCDSGVASWYDFAVAIAEEALRLGLITREPQIAAVSSAEYPLAAPRPRYSLLDKRATERFLGVLAPHWRSALRETLAGLAAERAAPAGAARTGSRA